MWELLKKIAELGWKPYGKDISELSETEKDIRLLTSRSSGLWQFVCENGMVNAIGSEVEIKNLNEGYGVVRDTDYQYRVLVSALCDEDKLEEFLLSNIKIGNED